MSGRTGPAPAAIDLTSPAFFADPYPFYAAVREQDPVHRTRQGSWLLTRFTHVHEALVDPRLSNAPSRFSVLHPGNRTKHIAADVAHNILPFLDPPAHTRVRRLVAQSFGRFLEDHPPPYATLVHERIEPLRGRDRFDLLGDFAAPLARDAIACVMGVEGDDRETARSLSRSFFRLFAPIPSPDVLRAVNDDLARFRSLFHELVHGRRREPRPDFVSALLVEPADGEVLDDEVLVDNLLLLFADGIENVDRAVANSVLALLRHPHAFAQLRERPECIDTAVEELLRYDSPAQFIARIVREPFTLHGARIEPGQVVVLGLGAANRDPHRFPDPDTLDLERADNPHLSFGRGRHGCLGGRLVHDQIAAALRGLFDAWPDLTLASDQLDWRHRVGHRWLRSLPVLRRSATP